MRFPSGSMMGLVRGAVLGGLSSTFMNATCKDENLGLFEGEGAGP